jgi:hypothetical protein
VDDNSNKANPRVALYDPLQKDAWDQFVRDSKQGHFMFRRDYMEYHADRFLDHSLMFYAGDRLSALMASSRDGNTFISHGGLTFGGVISNRKMKVAATLQVFESLVEYLGTAGITRMVYKAIPHIYHSWPAEEDLYALFRCGATLVRRDVSSTIDLRGGSRLSKGRKWAINQSRKNSIEVSGSNDFAAFMQIEKQVLAEKYVTTPVHTATEIELLHNRFPDNIRLYGAFHSGQMVGGVIVYATETVAHTQYMAATQEARDLCALDAVLSKLINEEYADRKFFDFGISTEKSGHYLNEDLAAFKESWGASGVVYDTYELMIGG